ncbi:MAG: antibiotic biosynthesis monooxygenase [Phaeodactylibacter sp.]|nr:antibiotic biosynthesis monooxygenase [Phaeodactylibacter sp.]MCB9286595.1 antibiotic biosynthesis monooxygenase [Lewinellaceae bacterium]
MNKYGLYGKLNALPGKGNELAAILLEAAELVRNARGCNIYLIGKDANNADTIWVTEVWDSKEDHDESLKADAVRQLIGRAMPLLDGRPEGGTELEVLGGVGVE